jgi:cell migration-inducing and hyaluronan-binding protein
VKLSRIGKNNGKEFSVDVGTNVRAGMEIKATTERTSMDLHVLELDAGSWVILEIPGFTKAASGAQQDSLDALRKASVTSYFKDADALWVKLVSPGDDERGGHGGGERLQVSR